MTIDRNQLVLTLLEQLTAKHSEPFLTIGFDCICDHLNDEQQTVTFQKPTGETFLVHYARLIGADGARSQVREQLATHFGFSYEQDYVPDAYKSIFLDRKNPEKGIELAPDRIHAANFASDCCLILAPQPGDRLHGAFIFNANNNPLKSFSTKEEILAYFEKKGPTFRALMSPAEAEALLQRPVARLVTVKCDRFHYGDRILLLGDAAHAVSPSIGQGCNSALEDIAILNQLLDQNKKDGQDNWSQAIAQFSQKRVADAHALQALSNYSFPRSKWLIPEFFFRLIISRKLHKWFPKWFTPFVFDLVLDTDLSYSDVLRLSQGWINKVERSMST